MGIFGNGNVTWDRYRSVMICMGHIFIVKYAHPCVYIYKYRYDIYIYYIYNYILCKGLSQLWYRQPGTERDLAACTCSGVRTK